MRTLSLGRSKRFFQVTLNDLPVLPPMLENESFLAGILGGKNVGTLIWEIDKKVKALEAKTQ
jgi:hypothetical protein